MEHALFVSVFKNESLDSIKFSRLFSSAVLGENLRYGYSFGNVVVVGLQKLWHRPVIIESIYFKLRSMCLLSKEQSILLRETTQNAILFSRIMPLFQLGLFFVHFVISMLLLKVLTWNAEYICTIQRAIHTSKGDNSKCIFFLESCPFYDLHFLSSIKLPTAER